MILSIGFAKLFSSNDDFLISVLIQEFKNAFLYIIMKKTENTTKHQRSAADRGRGSIWTAPLSPSAPLPSKKIKKPLDKLIN